MHLVLYAHSGISSPDRVLDFLCLSFGQRRRVMFVVIVSSKYILFQVVL